MKVTGAYQVDAPRARVYAMLQDPEVLARCIPGCDKLERTGPDEYRMQMKLLIASVSGSFEGGVRLADHQPPSSFVMHVDGKGRIGFMKGAGALTLKESGTATDVSWEGDVQLGGTIAAIGQRLVDTTSKLMIRKFFDKFSELAKAGDLGSAALA